MSMSCSITASLIPHWLCKTMALSSFNANRFESSVVTLKYQFNPSNEWCLLVIEFDPDGVMEYDINYYYTFYIAFTWLAQIYHIVSMLARSRFILTMIHAKYKSQQEYLWLIIRANNYTVQVHKVHFLLYLFFM